MSKQSTRLCQVFTFSCRCKSSSQHSTLVNSLHETSHFPPTSMNMGKLSEITMNASNGKRLSASSMGYQTLDDSSENLGKKAPRFMSPTVSSTKQTNVRPNGHGSTPSPLTSSAKARANGNWMSSAAKRVGLNRVGDGTPRSRKEALAKQPKALSFPDKVRQKRLCESRHAPQWPSDLMIFPSDIPMP